MALPMPDEKIWELKLQIVVDQIKTLSDKVDDKLNGLAEVLKSVNENFVKILDDHENRLRAQAAVDSSQAQEISALREKIASFSGELNTFKIYIQRIEERQQERLSSENDNLKKLALKLLEYILVGGASGGAVYAAHVMRLY